MITLLPSWRDHSWTHSGTIDVDLVVAVWRLTFLNINDAFGLKAIDPTPYAFATETRPMIENLPGAVGLLIAYTLDHLPEGDCVGVLAEPQVLRKI